jgi:hypothetical protein
MPDRILKPQVLITGKQGGGGSCTKTKGRWLSKSNRLKIWLLLLIGALSQSTCLFWLEGMVTALHGLLFVGYFCFPSSLLAATFLFLLTRGSTV